MKEIDALIKSGKGYSEENKSHNLFGKQLWRYESTEYTITLFEKGFFFKNSDTKEEEILFSKVNQIKSFLNAEILFCSYKRIPRPGLVAPT